MTQMSFSLLFILILLLFLLLLFYYSFEDLKPPTSPTPNPPIAQQNVTIAEAASKPNTDAQASKLVTTDGFLEATSNAVEVKKKRPLSPYTS